MPQLEHIKAIENRLWDAADNLRANSNYASNEYFLPVMGLVFLRHAYSRYLAVKDDIKANLPTRRGKPRELTKEDFAQQSAIFLRDNAQFDHLVDLPDRTDRAKAIIEAMKSIEEDYPSLRGALPQSEYRELSNAVLGQLLRALNPDELKQVDGDVFGRIYEYFLTKFADEKAHDGGEFFTPISIVSLIAHVLNPERGTVLDPACGSGGMFVQSARTVEEHGKRPADQLTFRGLEKSATTIRLAKMNLAVHGLEGDIKKAITYYNDPHKLVGKANYVMANPPFNVDQIDASRIAADSRLPFGLPGVNQQNEVSNGNYIWISYFYSYLSEKGRAGFVMSSQASSAGGGEALVRQKLIETGDVETMIAIRSNFFYTRTVPCELWFLNRAKSKAHRDKVLMIDARNLYRKVTRRIYDFSPEQQRNLLAIVWLYRGETERYLELISDYLSQTVEQAQACLCWENEDGESFYPVPDYINALNALHKLLAPILKTMKKADKHTKAFADFTKEKTLFAQRIKKFENQTNQMETLWEKAPYENTALNKLTDQFVTLTESSQTQIEQTNLLHRLATQWIKICHAQVDRDITRARKVVEQTREDAVEQLKQVRYFWQQAHWLTERFPEAKLRDVAGLVKLADITEIKANDWSLSPGRYVGVAPEMEDADFNFGETMREIHLELDGLNAEAVALAATIKKNFAGLEV